MSEDINVGGVLEALNGKVDIDLGNCPIVANTDASNFTTTGKETVVGWGMPDYTGEIEFTSSGYTAPADGFIFCGVAGNASQVVNINGHPVAVTFNTGASGSYPQLCLPVSKGDVFTTNAGFNWGRFYPLKGVN